MRQQKKKKYGRNDIVVFIVKDQEVEESVITHSINKLLLNCLESYEISVNYYYLEQLPRTLIGKVDYRKLEEMVKS